MYFWYSISPETFMPLLPRLQHDVSDSFSLGSSQGVPSLMKCLLTGPNCPNTQSVSTRVQKLFTCLWIYIKATCRQNLLSAACPWRKGCCEEQKIRGDTIFYTHTSASTWHLLEEKSVTSSWKEITTQPTSNKLYPALFLLLTNCTRLTMKN